MAHMLMFLHSAKLQYLVMKLENCNLIISLKLFDLVFVTPLQHNFGPIFDFSGALDLHYYVKMTDMLLFLPSAKVQYLVMKLEHCNLIISLKIVDFVFLTHLQPNFGPIFDFSGILDLNYYFKMAHMLLFFPSTKVQYLVMKLEHCNLIIYLKIIDFVF